MPTIEYKTCLKTARQTIMTALLAQNAGAAVGKQAHYQYLPPISKTWALFIGGGGRAENTWNQQATELLLNADLEGLEETLEAAEERTMLMMMALPVVRTGNIQICRVRQGGLPDIQVDFIRRANDKKEVPVWHWSIGLEVCLNTTSTYA